MLPEGFTLPDFTDDSIPFRCELSNRVVSRICDSGSHVERVGYVVSAGNKNTLRTNPPKALSPPHRREPFETGF